MSEMESKPKITLDELLQVKRAERPPPEFWNQFEKELRTKQLAALVQIQPWWRGLLSRKVLVRFYAPLGAAAAVALTFSSYSSRVASQGRPVETAVAVLQKPGIVTENVALAVPMAEVPQTQSQPVAQPEVAVAADISQHASAINASTADAEQVIASSTATVKAAGQVLAQLVGLTEIQPAKLDDARSRVVEPLSQVATPRDNRRARLLAYTVAYDPHAADSADAARSRERITHRISDQSIYDSISRLGVSGDRVSIKF